MRGCAGPSAPWSPAAAPQAAPRGKPRRVRAVRRTPHAAPRPAAPLRAPPRSATPRPAPRAAASPRPAAHPSRARALCMQAAAKAACRDAALAMRAAAEQADRASVAYAHGISPQHRITASCPCTSPVAMLPPAHLPPTLYTISSYHHIPPHRYHLATLQGAATDEHVVQYGGPTPGTIPFRYANKNLPVCASDAKTHAPSRHCTAYTSRPCIYRPCTYVHAGWAAALRAACGAAARISRSVIRANHVRGDVCELPYVLATPRMSLC